MHSINDFLVIARLRGFKVIFGGNLSVQIEILCLVASLKTVVLPVMR